MNLHLMMFILKKHLPKIKNEAFVINLDEFKQIVTHWIPLYVNSDNGSVSYDATYLDGFRVENIPKGI